MGYRASVLRCDFWSVARRDCGSNLFLTNDQHGKLQCNPFHMHTHVYTHALTQHAYTQTCRKLTIHYTSILQRSWSQCETCNGARMTILWRFAPDPKHGWLLGLYSAYDNHVHSPFTGAEARHYQSHLSSISPPTPTHERYQYHYKNEYIRMTVL